MCLPFLAPIGVAIGASAANAAAVGTLAAFSLAATAASAGLSFAGQKQAADAQEYQYKEGQRLANENLMLQYQQMAVRQREEQIAKSQQVQQITAEARNAFSTIATEAGEAGIQGNTVNILMGEFERQQGEALANLNLNYDFRNRQLQLEQLGMRGQAEAAMIRAYPTQGQPSIFSPLLQVGAGALNTVNMYGNLDRMGQTGGSNVIGPYSSISGRQSFTNSLPSYYRVPGMGRWY
jgi:hypothetical protein